MHRRVTSAMSYPGTVRLCIQSRSRDEAAWPGLANPPKLAGGVG